jgi:hypothetical protein
MSNSTPYETLGLGEQASYEEIQAARTRLSKEFSGDQAKLMAVEAAYDALLMERLRLRQEGKIKVPEGVRQADRADSRPMLPSSPPFEAPGWLQNWTEKPDQQIGTFGPAALFFVLSAVLALSPTPATAQLLMAMATGGTLFFIYRKGSGLGRSVLVGFGGLILGFLLGSLLYGLLLKSQIPGLPPDYLVVSWVLYGVLWLLSTFLK